MYYKKENGMIIRAPLEGPESIICLIMDNGGRVLTQAIGKKHKKFSAKEIARIKALKKLKKKFGRKWIETDNIREFEIKYQEIK